MMFTLCFGLESSTVDCNTMKAVAQAASSALTNQHDHRIFHSNNFDDTTSSSLQQSLLSRNHRTNMCSLKAILLSVSLLISAVPITATIDLHNETLVIRADVDHDRCPGDPVPITKPNDTAPTTNGCGVGIFAGKLPKEELFHECCNAHDICYGNRCLSRETDLGRQQGS